MCLVLSDHTIGEDTWDFDPVTKQMSMDWFCWGKSSPETHGFLPSNWLGFPVKIVPSSNSMNMLYSPALAPLAE